MKYIQVIPEIYDNYLKNLLVARGIEQVDDYVFPKKEHILNPFLLTNMQQAVETIHNFLNKKIALLVDPDMDGFSSSAIIYQYLHDVNPDVDITYFLHEGKGHGLDDIKDIIGKDFDLLILPDASSNDYEYHKEYKEAGVEIVILDHHEAEKLSPYACVVNNQLSDNYPNKELTGAGVVYKFCQAFDQTYGYNFADKYIDLAAVGIIGDMADIRNLETRYIVETGLKNITNSFLLALIEKQAYSIGSSVITPTAVSFYLVPLVNALVRVGKESEKETMFQAFIKGDVMVQSTKRGAKVGEFEGLGQQAARICTNARSRQNRQKDKALDALEMTIEKNSLNENKIIIVPVTDDSIDNTLTGLVAMALVSKYKKPVLVGRESNDGFLRGSGRCPDKTELTDLRQFLSDSGFFGYAEGHASAFGHEIALKNIDRFTAYANEKLANINFNEGIYTVDFIRNAKDGDIRDLILELGEKSNLWAKGNEEPYIVVKDIVLDPSEIQLMGTNKDTVKFSACGLDFLKFKDASFAEQLKSMKRITITVLGRANINNFMGNISPQFFIEDYEVRDSYYDF